MTYQTTYSKARASLASLCNRAEADRDVILIQRRGREDVALIAASELSSLMETAHLLRSPANAKRLLTARRVPRRKQPNRKPWTNCVVRWGLTKQPETKAGPKQRIAVFEPEFREDLPYWVETERKTALRAFDLIEAAYATRSPGSANRNVETPCGRPVVVAVDAGASHRLSGQ